MASGVVGRLVADVKCYYCGHVSGQMVGRRGQPVRSSNFVPRPGYRGPEPRAGVRMRCERCGGPVFLEESTANAPMRLRRRPAPPEGPRRAA